MPQKNSQGSAAPTTRRRRKSSPLAAMMPTTTPVKAEHETAKTPTPVVLTPTPSPAPIANTLADKERRVKNPKLLETVRDAYVLYGGDRARIVRATSVSTSTYDKWKRDGLLTGRSAVESFSRDGLDAALSDAGDLRSKVWSVAEAALDQVKVKLPGATARDAAGAFAQLFDRGRLLDGMSTANVNVNANAELQILEEIGLDVRTLD